QMASVVAAESGRSQLVELKALSGGYPFYGRLVFEDPGPPEGAPPLAERLGDANAAVAPELLQRLGIGRGGRIRIGTADVTVTEIVISEPDRVSISFTLGPRVMISEAGLAR